jgi:phage shock protein PspC (stress-responsive transcriptional regulator)
MSTDSDTQQPHDSGPAGQPGDAQSEGGRFEHAQHHQHARVPIRRAAHGRMLAGVAAGLARSFGIDVNIIRIGFVVLAILGLVGSGLGFGGVPFYLAGIPLYLALWLLIPEDGHERSIAAQLLSSVQSRSSR